MSTFRVQFSVMILLVLFTASAQAVVSAGTLLVDLNANDPTAGTASWTNTAAGAAAVGNFAASGTPTLVNLGAKANQAVEFSGDDIYRSVLNAPAGLVGLNPSRSIEVWTFNPGPLESEETVVSWGRRGGPDGTNMAFNYGNNGSFGAVGQWGPGPDLGWGATGAPAAGQWQHLVYVHDDATGNTHVYQNGVLKNTEAQGGAVLNTHTGTDILVGGQHDNANGVDAAFNYTGAIAQVRIHDGALSESAVASNFMEEFGNYFDTVSPLPIHRYSFNGDVTDSIGGAHGTLINANGGAAFGGGQLALNNPKGLDSGLPTGNYVELPTSIMNGLDAVTIEGWGTFENVGSAWSRIFDFGDQTSNGVNGRTYIFLTPRSGGQDTRIGLANPVGDSPGFTAESNVIVPGQPLDQNVPVHFAAVFDDNNDIMQLFINGMLVGETATTRNLTDISFINAWLGRSLYDPDDYLNGSYDELRIYGEALSVGQILGNFKVGPDSLNSSVIPEPATAFLGLAGLAMLGMRRRRSH